MLTQERARGLQLAVMRVLITICSGWLAIACASQAAHSGAAASAASGGEPESAGADQHAGAAGPHAAHTSGHAPGQQPHGPPPRTHGHGGGPALSAEDSAALQAIRGVHGGAGPWVVAGFRMGRFALARLALPQGSFDVEVIHHAPREVQYSCIADGAAAATGASLGRLNLSLEPAAARDTRTTYRNKRNGTSLTLELTPEFAQRYADLPHAQLSAAGMEVMQLPDAEIFRESH